MCYRQEICIYHNFSMNKKISLIEILKSRGPRMDFWGILLVALALSLYEKPVFLS